MKTVVCSECYDSVDVFSKATEFTCKKGHNNIIRSPKGRWNSTLKIKPKRKARKVKRVKVVPIPKLVKKADVVFSQWIRNRDKNKCVLCGSKTRIQCGHLIKRSKKVTRYDERNCNALCSSCNYKDNFEHDHYVVWFINKYGIGEYTEIVEQSNDYKKWTREELLKIISKYGG